MQAAGVLSKSHSFPLMSPSHYINHHKSDQKQSIDTDSKIRKQPVRILFPSSKHAIPCTCACYKECQKSQNRHRFSRLPGRQISRRQQTEQEPCRHRSQDRRQNSISGMLLIREFNFSLFHVFLQILPGGAVHNPDILPEYSASDHPHHSFLPAAQAVKVR